jgi:hypothetical protein
MKAYWESGSIAPLILWPRQYMVVSGQLHAPATLPPRERGPGTHWIGVWVGPRAVLDAVVKRKIHSPRRESNPRTPIVQPVAQRYTDWAITALYNTLYGREFHRACSIQRRLKSIRNDACFQSHLQSPYFSCTSWFIYVNYNYACHDLRNKLPSPRRMRSNGTSLPFRKGY